MPSFRCLDDLFEVKGLHSRTPAKFVPIAEKWKIPAITDLRAVDFSAIDLVVVTVPTNQNAAVLESLRPHAGRLHLLLDTPIAGSQQEAQPILPLLKLFASVTIAEDHMNFPFHALARKAAAEGLIGKPRSLSLYNIGYMYHGLSILRSFTGFAPITAHWRKVLGGHARIVGYEFADGFTGTLIGPYRRQDKVGGLVLEGSEGIISESPTDAAFLGHGRKMYLLQPLRTNGVLFGYQLKGPNREIKLDLPNLATMRALDFPDRSEINLIQNCALMEVILSVFHRNNINNSYGYENGLYDSLASQRADAGDSQVNPMGLLKPEA